MLCDQICVDLGASYPQGTVPVCFNKAGLLLSTLTHPSADTSAAGCLLVGHRGTRESLEIHAASLSRLYIYSNVRGNEGRKKRAMYNPP